jgi:hypothetical protein
MSSIEDLWPSDIAGIKTDSPIVLLQEQAAKLGSKTHNVVTAELATSTLAVNFLNNKDFATSFLLVAPAINYRFKLFTVNYDISFYPIGFGFDTHLGKEVLSKIPATDKSRFRLESVLLEETPMVFVANEIDFIAILRVVFNADRTKRIVSALVEQSRVIGTDDVTF